MGFEEFPCLGDQLKRKTWSSKYELVSVWLDSFVVVIERIYSLCHDIISANAIPIGGKLTSGILLLKQPFNLVHEDRFFEKFCWKVIIRLRFVTRFFKLLDYQGGKEAAAKIYFMVGML